MTTKIEELLKKNEKLQNELADRVMKIDVLQDTLFKYTKDGAAGSKQQKSAVEKKDE